MKTTLVIGASTNPERYSYKAIVKLLSNKHSVYALSNKSGNVSGVNFFTTLQKIDNIDTVTLYINPLRQKEYYNYILELKPKRIIFNPGTENPELKQLAEQQNIHCVEACTLVMLSIGNY